MYKIIFFKLFEIFFDSTENILVKLDKEGATDNLKTDLFGQGEK